MAKAKSSTIDMSDRNYRRVKVVNKDGTSRHSAHNDDAVARALITFIAGGGELDRIIRDNKLTDKYPKGAKGFGNPGLFRMTLGGTLRALVRAGTPVKIGAIMVKTLEQRVADPSVGEAKPKKAKAAKKVKRARKAPVAEQAAA